MTAQNFNLVLLIKILPGKLNFSFFWVFFDFSTILSWIFMDFYPKWKFPNIFGIVFSLEKNISLKSGFNCITNSPWDLFLEMIFFKVSGPNLHCNLLIYLSKIPTKIWRCHVMFLNHFYAKIYFILLIFCALHQFFKSGPVGNFALQAI